MKRYIIASMLILIVLILAMRKRSLANQIMALRGAWADDVARNIWPDAADDNVTWVVAPGCWFYTFPEVTP